MEFQTILSNGKKIAYYTIGSGPTLVGLSGFGCSHFLFLDIIQELAKNFKIVLIDNRGMGNSDLTDTEYEMSDLASDALFVLDSLKITKFGIMGISMGGFIALELVKLAKDRVSALSLMCTTGNGLNFIQPIPLTEIGLRQFATFDPAIAAEYSTSATTHPDLKLQKPEQYKKIVALRILHRSNIEEQIRQNNAAIRFLNTVYNYKLITCPTIAMCGSQDRFVNPDNINAFKSNIEKCTTKQIENTDHFFFLEKPLEVANELNIFFKEVIKEESLNTGRDNE